MLNFHIGAVDPLDNITRKFAFKVSLKEELVKEVEDELLKTPVIFCVQAEHTETRTFFFSTDSYEDQKEWIKAMSDASEVNQVARTNLDTIANLCHEMVVKEADQQHPDAQTHNKNDSDLSPKPSNPPSNQEGNLNGKQGECSDEGRGPCPNYVACAKHPSNGPDSYGSSKIMPQNTKPPLSRRDRDHCGPEGHHKGGAGQLQELREQQENDVLRWSSVPLTAQEKVAQRKNSMAQLQQWVNQRRGMAFQDDIIR